MSVLHDPLAPNTHLNHTIEFPTEAPDLYREIGHPVITRTAGLSSWEAQAEIMASRSAIELLPPEIVLNIFNWLDRPPTSETNMYDQPSESMLKAMTGNSHLKQVSLVSKSWRTLVLPLLFRHVAWTPHVSSLSAFTLNPIPMLRFFEEQKLSRYVTTFTLLVDFVDRDAEARDLTPQIRPVDLEWLFDQIFSVVDPLRFTVIAPPTTLAAFMSRMLFLEDAWSFSIPYHVLSLSRTSRYSSPNPAGHDPESATYHSEEKTSQTALSESNPDHESQRNARAGGLSNSQRRARQVSRRGRPPVCPLFTIRPWTSLLLNEGSSTKVYRTYEFFLRHPPSMLSALLGCGEYPNDQPLIPASVVEMSYVAIFPLSSHFANLVRHLPRIKRLYVQLAPLESNRAFLDDRKEMSQIDPTDLWMERDMSYGFVMRKMVAVSNAAAAAAAAATAAEAGGSTAEHNHGHSGNGYASASHAADGDDDDEEAADWAALTGVQFGNISSTNVTTTITSKANKNWANLEVFECGDAAVDAEAWDMAVQALKQQQQHQNQHQQQGEGRPWWWKVEDRGRIVRVRQ